jgi:tRNA-2-methylthio-N6-dimethylallyladenosine synthase
VAQDRLEQLQDLQRGLTLAAHRQRVGEATEVLVEGESRRGGGQHAGRDPYHRVVNFGADPGPALGALVPVRIVEATPHSLIGEVVAAGRAVKGKGPAADEQGRSRVAAA